MRWPPAARRRAAAEARARVAAGGGFTPSSDSPVGHSSKATRANCGTLCPTGSCEFEPFRAHVRAEVMAMVIMAYVLRNVVDLFG